MLEELLQHPVGGVEHVLGEVVAGVDEPGGQAAAHTVDHGAPLLGAAILERKKIDFQDLAHAPTVASASWSGHRRDFVKKFVRQTKPLPRCVRVLGVEQVSGQ